MARAAILAMAAVFLVAGCAEAPTRPAAAGAVNTTEVAPSGGGTLLGVVLDEESFPLAGVQVQIVDTLNVTHGYNLETAETGTFEARNLAPGRYYVFALHPDYKEASKQEVQVVEGETTKVRFFLQRDIQYEAYVETIIRKQHYPTSVCLVGAVWASCVGPWLAGVDAHKNISFVKKIKENATGPLMGILIETQWVYTQSQCRAGIRTYVYGPDWINNFPARYWWTADADLGPPARLYLPREGDDPNAIQGPDRTGTNDDEPNPIDGEWQFSSGMYARGMTGNGVQDVDCMVDQNADSYFTFFWGQPMPVLDWTAIPT